MAVTSDSKYIVSGSWDYNVRLYNLQERRQEAILVGHTDWLTRLIITKITII